MSLNMDDILNQPLDEQLTEPIEQQHAFCFYCNGYYGPCFGEPVCATCHDFMFSEDLHLFQTWSSSSWFTDVKDDGDSGNDEPSEEAAGPSRSVNVRLPDNVPRSRSPRSPSPQPSPAEEDIEVLENGLNENDAERSPPYVDLVDSPSPPPLLESDPLINCRSGWPPRPQERMNSRLALLTVPRPLYEVISTSEDMSLRIPPEIWAAIFRKLDDVSLAMASKVSRKWKAIVLDQNTNSKWEEYMNLRWPLFHPVYPVADWYSVYCDFLDSVPCKLCFINLAIHLPFDNFPPTRSLRSVRLNKELKWLRVDHPEGVEAVPLDELNYNWLARITGPPQSPYQGGVFYLNLKVPHDYPLKPPVVRFLTRILHPNVSRHGDIGIDCIQHNWTLALTIPQILLSVQSLITDPYLETSMEPSISNLYDTNRTMFDKVARVWTWKYAMHDVLVH